MASIADASVSLTDDDDEQEDDDEEDKGNMSLPTVETTAVKDELDEARRSKADDEGLLSGRPSC